MSCNIKIKLGPDFLQNQDTFNSKWAKYINEETSELIFTSDQELDLFLADQAPLLVDWTPDKTFSLDDDAANVAKAKEVLKEVQKQYAKIPKTEVRRERQKLTSEGKVNVKEYYKQHPEELTDDLTEIEEYDVAEVLKNSYSVSKYIEIAGNSRDMSKPIITGKSDENYKKYFYESLMAEGKSKATIDELWKKEQYKGVLAARLGDDIHYIMQCLFEGKEIDKTKFYVLNDTAFNEYFPIFEARYKAIKEQYPDAEFFCEVPIVSKNIPDVLKSTLKQHNKNKAVDSINGRIDLLILDKTGKFHIVDWKTSSKHIGDWNEKSNVIVRKQGWWPTTKKTHALAQLGNYGGLLEQYGGEVESLKIEPFFCQFVLDEDGYPINEIEHIEYDTTVKNEFDAVGSALNYKKHAEWIFNVTKPITVGTLLNISEIMETLFPGLNATWQNQKRFEANIKYYKEKGIKEGTGTRFVKEYDPGSKEYQAGWRFYFYKNDVPDKGIVKAKSEAELDEKLTKYVEEVNKYRETELYNFASNFAQYMYSKTDDAKAKWLAGFNAESAQYLENRFSRYAKCGWQLAVNKELNENGIFIFTKNDKMEIVAISPDDLHHINYINGAHNILGSKYRDGQQQTDPVITMNTEWGNLLLMKVMCYLAENPQLTNGFTINQIKAMNPWQRSEVNPPSNSYLIDNWNRLSLLYKNKKLKAFSITEFTDDVQASMLIATDLLLGLDINTQGFNQEAQNAKVYTQEEIMSLMKDIEIKHRNDYKNLDTDAGYAYYQLQMALLHLEGIAPIEDPNFGNWLVNKWIPLGNKISQAQQSLSGNARLLEKLFSEFRESYTRKYSRVSEDFMKLVDDVYKEWGYNKATGNVRKFWEKFFVQNTQGLVDRDLQLKRPNNKIFEDKPKSQQLIKFITAQWFEQRRLNLSDEEMDRFQSSDEYYKVPLLEANFTQTVTENFKRNGLAGIWDGIKQKFNDAAVSLEGIYSGNSEFKENVSRKTSQTRVAYNKFADSLVLETREKLLGSKTAVFSTNVEDIFLLSAASAAVTEASSDYGPYFAAFQAALNYMVKVGAADIPDIVKYVDDYIDSKVFHEVLRSRDLDALHKALTVIKQLSSKATLGFSTRAMTREYLVSAYTFATRALTHQIPGVTAENFRDAIWFVIKQAPASLNTQNFITALNRRFAMSNYGSAEMGEANSRTKYGIRSASSDVVFIGTRLPDDLYRLSMLIARMMHDGCLEAYDVDGFTSTYDPRKDNRFKLYLSNPKGDKIKSEDLKEWVKQKQLYESATIQWLQNLSETEQAEHIIEIEGEKIFLLPDAYTPDEKSAIRTSADELFGYFDNESKSLLTASFLGSAFMQYKTWLSAKLNLHIKAPGFVNIWQKYQIRNDEGQPIWLVASTDEEMTNGLPPLRLIPENELNEDSIRSGQVVPYIIQEGTFQLGMVQATGAFLKDILTWNTDEFKEHWKNPLYRGQLINGLLDTLGMLLLAGLIQLLFGEEVVNNKADQNWITQWSYGVLMGFAEDGPITQILGSTFSDINPPAILALKQWAQTANSVLAGNKSIGKGLVESFGMTREFRGYFQQ